MTDSKNLIKLGYKKYSKRWLRPFLAISSGISTQVLQPSRWKCN